LARRELSSGENQVLQLSLRRWPFTGRSGLNAKRVGFNRYGGLRWFFNLENFGDDVFAEGLAEVLADSLEWRGRCLRSQLFSLLALRVRPAIFQSGYKTSRNRKITGISRPLTIAH
jgi:hypothetical protein